MNQPEPLTIPLDKLKPINCPVCRGNLFRSAFELRKLPALLSPTGQEQIVQLPAYVCINCEAVLDLSAKAPF